MVSLPESRQHLVLAASVATVLTGLAAVAVFRANKIAPAHSRRTVPSPRTTLLPHLSDAQVKQLGYPPDALPGSRDVNTPYGSMRVYEWGPETGRKVIFVHGITTPSPVFKIVADDLVARGCRVMLFDLWGRGYSDSPAECQHDSRLFGLQIHYALASSSIAWTGETAGRFSIIGFSLGGTITLDFFAHNPGLVESIVLLSPAGLLRKLPLEYSRLWFQYPTLLSKAALRRLIGTAVGANLAPRQISPETDSKPVGFTPAGACQFQFDHHQGHAASFLSTLQYGPWHSQEEIWKHAGDIVSGADATEWARTSALHGGRILNISGADDTVVPPDDVKEDLGKYFGGPTHFEFKTVPGNHGFVWPEGRAVAAHIAKFWGL